jgi:hypothetical protein
VEKIRTFLQKIRGLLQNTKESSNALKSVRIDDSEPSSAVALRTHPFISTRISKRESMLVISFTKEIYSKRLGERSAIKAIAKTMKTKHTFFPI